MKNILQISILFLFLSSCKGQKPETVYSPIVLKAKETSLYSDRVDWEKVNTQYIELTKGKESVEDLKEGLQFLINSLGDKHATIRSPKDYSIIVNYTGPRSDIDNRASDFVNNVINAPSQFSYQLMDNGVGYLRIMGIGPGDVKEQADLIRGGLLALKADGVDKWIVDLRYNGGGNMDPMITGLAPLIGEGTIAGSINRTNDIRPYTIENGQFSNYGRLTCEMDNLPKIAADEKVAVLMSRYTISSGELVAVAFKGRGHTRFIGEESAGYTTGNGYDIINDDLALAISQDVFMDRNEVRYDKKVGVDERIEFQHNVDLKDDNQIKSAVEWLNK